VDDSVSLILTVHNQERIIADIFGSACSNMSPKVKEIIVIFDGCTDNSEKELEEGIAYASMSRSVAVMYTPNLNETKANNVGLRSSSCRFSIILQDDCKILEPNFDERMLKPFRLFPSLLAVSGRDAVDTRLVDGKLDYYNCGGVDANTPRNIFSIRDGINRSPLMINNAKAYNLNYLDEAFAPLDSDDVDLSIRGYKEYGYIVGSYPILFESPLAWGKTRSNPVSAWIWEKSMQKNHKMIVQRHYDFIVGEKHSRDVEIK